jgi:hypothetical protein
MKSWEARFLIIRERNNLMRVDEYLQYIVFYKSVCL